MEKHIQTVLISLATAVLLWVGTQLQANTEQFARLDERFVAMSKELAEMKQQLRSLLESRYTQSDAERDFKEVRREIELLRGRVGQLEARQ